MIEYGLILAFVFIVILVSVHTLADQVVGTWSSVANKVTNAGSS